eukprot:SAG22_NODE_799_length_7128_cov_14.224356_5_plen_82_part_00
MFELCARIRAKLQRLPPLPLPLRLPLDPASCPADHTHHGAVALVEEGSGTRFGGDVQCRALPPGGTFVLVVDHRLGDPKGA